MRKILFLILAFVVAVSLAYGQETNTQDTKQEVKQEVKQDVSKDAKKSDAPEWKLGFTIFTGYFWNPSTIQNNATNFNSFYLSRAYIDFRVDFKNGLKLRVTPDVSPTTGGWILRLRHAFIDWELLQKLLVFSGGITRAEWVSYVDDFVGIRYITPSPADFFGLRASVDIGASLTFTPLNGFEIFTGVFDGNGFSRGSDNLQTNLGYINVTKEVGTRISVAPIYILTGDKSFEKVVLAFHSYNTILTPDMTNASGTELYGVGLLVNYSPISLAVEYSTYTILRQNVQARYGNYFGVFGKINFGFVGLKEVSLVGAFYINEPDNSVSDDERYYYLGGFEYQFNKNLSTSLNVKVNQRKNAYKDFGGYPVDHQTVIHLDTQIKL